MCVMVVWDYDSCVALLCLVAVKLDVTSRFIDDYYQPLLLVVCSFFSCLYLVKHQIIPHLLLVFSLCCQPGLDTLPCLHKRLSLGHFTWVVREHSCNVRAQEQHGVAPHLEKEG